MAAKSTKKRNVPPGATLVAQNRKARHEYEILDRYECGIMLKGMEVKSLREAKVTIADAYGQVDRGDIWIKSLHINPYSHASDHEFYDPERPRKLLLHRHEIERITQRVNIEHLQIVPLSLYFKDGRAKCEIAVARGKKQRDRRQDIAARDHQRDIDREMRRRR